MRVRDLGQPLDVDDLQGRVGRCLEVQHLAALLDFLLDGVEIAGVAQANFDVLSRQEFDEDLVGAAVGVLDRNHAIARLEQREQRVADGRHAGGEAGGLFTAVHDADFFLQRPHRWVGVARVDVALFFAERDVEPFVHVVVAEGHGIEHGQADRALGEQFFFASPDGVGASAMGFSHGEYSFSMVKRV